MFYDTQEPGCGTVGRNFNLFTIADKNKETEC